ncbi:hypothetical protein [Streptomyces sp. NPDC051098]|uniref:hypothetical protein n=1 Tax=Streptomyces sp. NPDC051098 TaxID=3155411 RepID=UPI003427EF81
MASDHPRPNTQLRAVRELDLQMSRTEFARVIIATGVEMGEHVGCTARLVAAWEDGDVDCPRAVYRRILTRLTGRTMSELGFRLPSPTFGRARERSDHRTEPARPGDGRPGRRVVLREGTGAALALIPLTGSGRGRGLGRIGNGEVDAVDQAVAQIYPHDQDHGSATLRRDAAAALHTAYQWPDGTLTERTEQRLRSATGHLSIAAGWLAYDSGRPADARSLYGEALAAARIGDDPALEGHAFGCLSLLAKASGRPREAIGAAQGAQTVIRRFGSPRMLALMAMREAGGWALLGDASAADQCIVRAHQLYARGPAEADPLWLEFFTPGELAGLEALARADLAQHERAAAGAEQAVLLHGEGFARNRALYTADIAIQHAHRERAEPEVAVEAAARVLAYLPAVRSDRLMQQLTNVASALQRHTNVPAVADWLEEYRTIATG